MGRSPHLLAVMDLRDLRGLRDLIELRERLKRRHFGLAGTASAGTQAGSNKCHRCDRENVNDFLHGRGCGRNSIPNRNASRPEMESPGPEPPKRQRAGTRFALLAEINRAGNRRRRRGSGVRTRGEGQTSHGGQNGNNFCDFHIGVVDLLIRPKTKPLCRESPATKALFCGRDIGRSRSFGWSLRTARTCREGAKRHQNHSNYFHCFHVRLCLLSNRSLWDPVCAAYREPIPVQA